VEVAVTHRVLLLLVEHLAVLGVVARVLEVRGLVQYVLLQLQGRIMVRHVVRAVGLLR